MSFRDTILENIAKHGVQLIGVTDTQPSFTYTIGLHAKFGFELIVVGLPYQYAGHILNEIAAKDMPPELGMPNTEYTNLPVMFMECTVSLGPLHDDFVCQADRFYGKEVKVVQMVMCDRQCRFPGHSEYDHEYMDPRQRLFCDF
jgi:hypothetical protein